MTEIEKSRCNWTGGTGFVSRDMLAQYLPAIQRPVYYLAGPPAMVAAMRHVLADAEVDEDDIRTEEFSGY
jgi:NAD(P)H-flavin reductase